jgi:hypothetical protein
MDPATGMLSYDTKYYWQPGKNEENSGPIDIHIKYHLLASDLILFRSFFIFNSLRWNVVNSIITVLFMIAWGYRIYVMF